MQIGNVRIVGQNVRVYDVDGSYVELCIEDVVDLEHWLTMHHAQLYNLLRRVEEEKRKREVVNEPL